MQSLASNVTNASPISDLNPVLLASGATLNLPSISKYALKICCLYCTLLYPADGECMVKMDSDFFTGYRTTTMKPNEILKSVIVPLTRKVFILYCVMC